MVGVPSTASAATVAGCPLGYLCLYKAANYNNYNNKPDAKYYRCGTYNLSNWVTRNGSYVDNQTGGVISVFWAGYNGTGAVLRAFKSYSSAPNVDFYPVNSITVC